MGSCCHPELQVEPLAFCQALSHIRPAPTARSPPRPPSAQRPPNCLTSSDNTKWLPEDDSSESADWEMRKLPRGKECSIALGQSSRSIESRLNQLHYEHIIGPPSSVRLSLIDRMENDSLPDDLFVSVPPNAEKLHGEFGRMVEGVSEEIKIRTSHLLQDKPYF